MRIFFRQFERCGHLVPVFEPTNCKDSYVVDKEPKYTARFSYECYFCHNILPAFNETAYDRLLMLAESEGWETYCNPLQKEGVPSEAFKIAHGVRLSLLQVLGALHPLVQGKNVDTIDRLRSTVMECTDIAFYVGLGWLKLLSDQLMFVAAWGGDHGI